MNQHTNNAPDSAKPGENSGAFPDDIQGTYEEPEIVSVNSKDTKTGNKAGKTIFILVASAMLIGLLSYLGQNYLNAWKQSAKGGKREVGTEVDPMNPEAARVPVTQVGAATGNPPPQFIDPAAEPAATPDNTGVRPIRGANGEVVTDAQGRALGVDTTGNVVTVPAITPLPSEQQHQGQQTNAGAQQPAQAKPSRYGGNLFAGASGSTLATPQAQGTTSESAKGAPVDSNQQKMTQQIELIKSLMGIKTGGTSPANSPEDEDSDSPETNATPKTGIQARARIPVVKASRFPNQNMMLPRGRQAACVLTSRIDDQLPGFTSCTLLNNLYSDNGKTLLLERGSDITGEYGNVGQPGLSRIAVNWIRIKTPDGVVVDLDSPGTDPLGGSGLPGHYNPRWPERIGAALLVSLTKDVMTAVLNNQASKGGGTVIVNPGQETMSTGNTMSEQLIKETLKVRPNVTIAEGTRISIYVQRDLDFRPVYELIHAKRTRQ